MIDRDALLRDGYVLLRGAIPSDWLDTLRKKVVREEL